MAAHKDIRILFEIDGRKYEAVGFLAEGERSVGGDEMLTRTSGENHGAIGDEDEKFLSEHFDRLPVELQGYYLVTGRRRPDGSRSVSYFSFHGRRWYRHWDWLGSQWSASGLVGRRCA